MSISLISVIIPTFERFESVQLSINSVISQTYPNIEIIVVNDCSSDIRYKNLTAIYPDIKIIHLPINMRKKYNLPAAQGLTKNEGIKIAKGEWIAFLDDDDEWVDVNKLTDQIKYMKNYNCNLSCSNMFTGYGNYVSNASNCGLYFSSTFSFGKKMDSRVYKFDRKCIENTNFINNSSCIMHSSIIDVIGLLQAYKDEDYNYWLKAMKYTDGIYIQKPMVYYDLGHNGGKNYL